MEVVWAMKYWPNHVFAFLLCITEVNVNLAATYFCAQEQMSQIEFHKLLVKTLLYNNHYNDETDETPDKMCKKWETGHCLVMLPMCFFQGCEPSPQTVHIHNTSA